MRALIGTVALLGALSALAAAPARARRSHPPGSVRLTSASIRRVGRVVCGEIGANWVSGTLLTPHLFLADSTQRRSYRARARRARGRARRRDLERARYYGRRAEAGGALCNPKAPAPSIFGIDTGTYDSSRADFVKDFSVAQSLGARWDRFTLGAAAAAGDYAGIDYEVDRAQAHGMGVILSFGCAAGVPCPPTGAQALMSYQAYVQRILAHFHTRVTYYESWTEPNRGSEWGGAADPEHYAALLEAQYRAFQAFNAQHGTGMRLLFGSPDGFTTGPEGASIAVLPFVERVLAALGGGRPFDGVALHAYRYPASAGPGDPVSDYVGSLSFPAEGCADPSGGYCRMTWTQELEAYEQEFADHGYGPVPLWLTEFGWPGGDTLDSGYCVSNPGYCLGAETQEQYLRQAYADLLSPQLFFVQGALWFNLRDYQPGLRNPDPEFFAHFGLLRYDYTPKPAAAAFKELAQANPKR